MTVYLVGAGPGDPGLLTRRGAELLAMADVVLHDRLVDTRVLALAATSAKLVDVGKRRGGVDSCTQDEINQLLVECGRSHDVVVRLKGGDPFLFARGAEEVEALEAAGIDVEVVPGVSSALGVPAAVGIALTRRGLASAVTVIAGHDVEGWSRDRASIADDRGTLVVLMGVAQRGAIRDALVAAGRSPATPCAIIERGTTDDERVTRCRLAGLDDVAVTAPAVIVIGPVVASIDA